MQVQTTDASGIVVDRCKSDTYHAVWQRKEAATG
jgi:hypothetical protein